MPSSFSLFSAVKSSSSYPVVADAADVGAAVAFVYVDVSTADAVAERSVPCGGRGRRILSYLFILVLPLLILLILPLPPSPPPHSLASAVVGNDDAGIDRDNDCGDDNEGELIESTGITIDPFSPLLIHECALPKLPLQLLLPLLPPPALSPSSPTSPFSKSLSLSLSLS